MSMTCGDDDEKVVLVLILCTRKTTALCDVSLISIDWHLFQIICKRKLSIKGYV